MNALTKFNPFRTTDWDPFADLGLTLNSASSLPTSVAADNRPLPLQFDITNNGNVSVAPGQFGTLTDVYIANDRETGRPRGFAFVTFATEEESKVAAEKMNGFDLDGRQLTVNEARPKEESGGGGGRNFNSPNRRPGAFQDRGNRRY